MTSRSGAPFVVDDGYQPPTPGCTRVGEEDQAQAAPVQATVLFASGDVEFHHLAAGEELLVVVNDVPRALRSCIIFCVSDESLNFNLPGQGTYPHHQEVTP